MTTQPQRRKTTTIELAYPTEERFDGQITQAFARNVERYMSWGLPGHEGIDTRAPGGSVLFAILPGEVVEIGWRSPDHPYGYAVRVKTVMGDHEYESVYCHCADGSAKVKVGQWVEAGQAVAIADGTGNVTGDHLHYTLKRKGATLHGETKFPHDIIDPTLLFDLAQGIMRPE